MKLELIYKRSLMIGIAGMVLTFAGFFMAPEQSAFSYLAIYLYIFGLTLGCFPIICLHHLTGGQWGYPIRRVLEISTRTIPLLALLFVPILFRLSLLYPWAQPETVLHDEILKEKQLYLNTAGFVLRAAFYFILWWILSLKLNHNSLHFDHDPEEKVLSRLQALGAIGLILYGLTSTFSAIDWSMSLEPHWYSTTYGFIFMTGQTLSAFCLATWFVLSRANEKPFSNVLSPARSHDLGNLIFAFVLLWAYIAVTQFIIIWSGNLAEEAPWYLKRTQGPWLIAAMILILFHFAVPFLLLLMRAFKRNYEALRRIAVLILIFRLVEVFWLVKPANRTILPIHVWDLTALAGIGGLWAAYLSNLLRKEKLTFEHDPLLNQTGKH